MSDITDTTYATDTTINTNSDILGGVRKRKSRKRHTHTR